MPTIRDMTGERYGLWLVIRRVLPHETSAKSLAARWLCECKCGLQAEQEGSSLRRGKSKGCRSCTRLIQPYRAIYNTMAHSAKNRGMDFTLTYEDYLEFTKEPACHYCGEVLVWVDHCISKKGQQYNLDRMDSSQGYHAWNCVPCCKNCNQTKSHLLTYEEMKVIGEMRKQSRQFVPPSS